MAAMSVTVCFRELLRDICERLAMPTPRYGIPVESDGFISVAVTETIRCWGAPSVDVDKSEEDAARRAVGRLREEFDFEVIDYNLNDKKFYENLYARISNGYSSFHRKYKRFKSDYCLLKGYYAELMTEKDRSIAECEELKKNMRKCVELLSPISDGVAAIPGSRAVSEDDPETPSGYRG